MNELEYIDSQHLYLLDGVVVPSVTQLLHNVFPDKYKNVPSYILNNKAEYGTAVHEAIETLERTGTVEVSGTSKQLAIEQYKRLKEVYSFTVIEQEKPVFYSDKYAGRYDMVIDNKAMYRCLCDIKTTAVLDERYLSYQLSLYEMAYEYTNKTKPYPFHTFYCIWLPKNGAGELREIGRIDRTILKKKLGL